jgi:hypothetical protein
VHPDEQRVGQGPPEPLVDDPPELGRSERRDRERADARLGSDASQVERILDHPF